MTESEQRLVVAFVQGAAWWEYRKTKATLWPTDRDLAEQAAVALLARDELGLSLLAFADRRMKQREEKDATPNTY